MNGFDRAGLCTLAECRLFIFDLDGTLYSETHHFSFYGRQIESRLPAEAVAAFREDEERALALRHALRYGRVYDAARRLLRDGDKAYDWDGRVVQADPPSPDDVLIHIQDPWWIYGVLAAHYGLDRETTHQAFLATRAHMESDDFQMTPLPGLREALLRLRDAGRTCVVATNSPEPDSRAILRKLGLSDVFADTAFLAGKPRRTAARFAAWRDHYGLSDKVVASVGDNYHNEIEPALAFGMATVYIDRYVGQARPEVTIQLTHPDQLGPLFTAVADKVTGEP